MAKFDRMWIPPRDHEELIQWKISEQRWEYVGPTRAAKLRSKVPSERRRLVMERDGGRCLRCGVEGTEENPLTVDHIIPKSRGGTNAMVNLQTLCRDCHNKKDAVPKKPRKRQGVREAT